MEYSVPDAVLAKLAARLPADAIDTAADSLTHWGRDWTRDRAPAPAAVVFPRHTEEVVAIVDWARAHGIALVPSGGRTGLSGGAVAAAGEVVVSLDRMNRILNVDPVSRLLHCQAGTVTGAIQAAAEAAGLFYPVDFASSGSSQIGGNVATNAGGIKVIRYGMTREWVRGLTVVTGAGQTMRLNRGLVKNNTGYDLRHLFIGSEGTLGIVTEVELGLAAPPPPLGVLFLAVPDFAAVQQALMRFGASVTLSAFEFLSESALEKVVEHQGLARPLAQSAPFYVLLEFEAPHEDAHNKAFETFEAGTNAGWIADGTIGQSLQQNADLWRLREDISESIARFTPYKNDLSVQPARLSEFLEGVETVVSARYPDLEVCWFGHIGDGNLHLNILRPESLSIDAFYERCHQVSDAIMGVVQALGGSISAEHGVGLLKRDFLHFSRSADEIDALRGIKALFDPGGIMNPGKLLPPS